MNKTIFVKTIEALEDGMVNITYTEPSGGSQTKKAALCATGEHYIGFDETPFLILTFETMQD
jgi:hypothetical protein